MLDCPNDIQDVFGYALDLAQRGDKYKDAKPLKGFGGASVLEVVGDHSSGTYRAVYTARYRDAVYVLHVFKKKSMHGIVTPKADLDLIRARLRSVEAERTAAQTKR